MARVTYKYPCGHEITTIVTPEAHRDYGKSHYNGSRVKEIHIQGRVSADFLHKWALLSVNPLNGSVYYKGKRYGV